MIHLEVVKSNSNVKKWWMMAGVLLIGIGIGALMIFGDLNSAVTQVTVATDYGETKEVTLPDGTKVSLNAGSTISYPEDFTDSIRLISLVGEAYFQVTADATHPFVIRSSRSQTRVIGTAFNLRDFEKEDFAELSVSEGKVEFADLLTGEEVLLTKGNQGILKDHNLSISTSTAEVAVWRARILKFDKMTLQQINVELEKWFGIEVRVVNHDLLSETFTGEFTDPTLHDVVSSLGFALGFSYKYQGQILTIY